MKYFIIEISKPYDDNNYKAKLQERINNKDFEVVKVCSSYQESEKEIVKFQIENVKKQSHKHYEIISGDGSEGFAVLQKELENFYNRIK